jgi:hypothetical protein
MAVSDATRIEREEGKIGAVMLQYYYYKADATHTRNIFRPNSVERVG